MNKDTFAIASIGFEERDQNVLVTLVTLAKTRKPCFILFESAPDRKLADILIVNSDKADAVQRWNAYLKLNEKKATISSIMVCDDPPPANENDRIKYIKKPLVATKLLSLLEEVVIADHGYAAPQVFQGDITNTGDTGEHIADSAEGAAKNGITALVVDDSLPVRIQMKKALHNIAEKVDFAETGEEAEKLIHGNKYDIVFLDVILPGVDGYDLCKLIKKDPDKGQTPVIMLTSNSSPADRIKGKMAGCDTYLIKPVRQDIFKEVIYEYLELE